jgi:hypothetical protein
MLRTLKCPVIALEEHYWDKELAALFAGAEGVRDPQTLTRRGRADACTACRRCLNPLANATPGLATTHRARGRHGRSDS